MKKIVLLGDSIRMGYDKYVKESLKSVAEVYYTEENCKFVQFILRFVHEWKEKGAWPSDVDLVHWNAGLWDELELFGDEPITSLDYYKEAILRVHKRLRMLFPKAKIVFATSTCVLEDKLSPDFRRHNATIKQYNEGAVEVLAGTDAIINDLYAITERCPESYHSDGVHYYTDEGTAWIGGKVLAVLCKELGIQASEVDIKNFDPKKYSVENIGY